MAGVGARVGAQLVRAKLSGEGFDEGVARHVAERLVSTLGEMKGLALKAGQSMAMVADSLPPEAHAQLSQLFSHAPTLPFADIQAAVEAQLGAPLHTVFAEVDPNPLAAASLAQVHAGRLLDGSEVVLKVQYPSVAQALRDDLRNLGTLGKLTQFGGALLDGRAYVQEVSRELENELDYTREADSLEAYRQAIRGVPGLVVPRHYPAYTRPGLLVLERLHGMTLQAYCEKVTDRPHAERQALAELMIRAVCTPLIEHRLIYGDTHPGNFMVLPQGDLGVLDYGCMRRLSEPFVTGSVGAFKALLAKDSKTMVAQLRLAGFTVDLTDAQAEALCPELARISVGFLLAPYVWTEDSTIERLTALRRQSPLLLARLRPPAEGLLVYRALSGVTYNLRRLQVTADFTPLTRELSD